MGGVRTHRWISCIFQCWSAPVGIASVVGYFWVLSVSLFLFWRRREVCTCNVVGYSWYRCQCWTSRMDISTWSRSRLTALHLHLGKWHDQISEFCPRSQFECQCYSCLNVRFDKWQSLNESNRKCQSVTILSCPGLQLRLKEAKEAPPNLERTLSHRLKFQSDQICTIITNSTVAAAWTNSTRSILCYNPTWILGKWYQKILLLRRTQGCNQ